MAGKVSATRHIDWGEVVARASEFDSISALAREFGIRDSTFRNAIRREGVADAIQEAIDGQPQPGTDTWTENTDGSITATVDSWWSAEEVIRAHGQNPDDFVIVRWRFNRWGHKDEPMGQLRFDAIPKEILPQPPEITGLDIPPARPLAELAGGSFRLAPDQHAPYHDRALHANFCADLAESKPAFGILMGDLLDFESISRHRKYPNGPGVNDSLRAAVSILRDYRAASPDTHWTLLRGNHDERVQYQILDQSPGLHNIAPAGDGPPALSLRNLLLLDALGIDFIDEEWNRARHPVTRKFIARHGGASGKAATDQMLAKHGKSQVQGHLHRLEVRYRMERDPDEMKVAVLAGFMGQNDQGLGYADDPDWHQGYIAGHAWEDGDFTVSPVPYVDGRSLLPDGRRYMSDPALNDGHRPSDWRN